MSTRRARTKDAPAIHRLVAHYAAEGVLLPRTEEEICRNISHFLVLEENRQVIGCLSLESYGSDLAEVRSVAVGAERRGEGLGARLVEFGLLEARGRGIVRVFAVTHAPQFFERQGFAAASRKTLVEKFERDCRTCPKQRTCKLVAVIATVIPERVVLPVLGEISAAPAC
ncbi:MAG: GNAT family N-acetyltransferase [Candidatus Acidiferrales bacterium]